MSGILERLRYQQKISVNQREIFKDAADEITQLRQQLEWAVNIATKKGEQIKELEAEALPNERGTNRYGVDVAYFRKTINRELNRDLSNFPAADLARVFARLSRTADANVMHEPEFAKAQPEAGEAVAWVDNKTFSAICCDIPKYSFIAASISGIKTAKNTHPLYKHPTPVVPDKIKEYGGHVSPEDGNAAEYYVDGWNECREAMLSAAQENAG